MKLEQVLGLAVEIMTATEETMRRRFAVALGSIGLDWEVGAIIVRRAGDVFLVGPDEGGWVAVSDADHGVRASAATPEAALAGCIAQAHG